MRAIRGHQQGVGPVFGEPPCPFNYPKRRLTMEEMLVKFIDEGRREHEEMEIFIKEFRTTNELLLKTRSNLLRVTTRGGKMTSEATRSKEINEIGINENEPFKFEQDVQEKPHDDDLKKLVWRQRTKGAQLSCSTNWHQKKKTPGVLTERKIADKFFDEHLMVLNSKSNNDKPWYADFVNYIVGKEPYAFKLCVDNITRRCVAGSKTLEILAHCHSGPTSGHHSANVTSKKVYESGFYRPSVFKDANEY
ncbi:hypothetical protein Tco_0425448 [Tanacetum coccineum]